MTGGFSPGSKHGTGSFGQLSNHMNSSEVFELNSAAIGDSSHFLIILLIGVWKCDLIVQVKDSPKSKV